MPDLTTAEIDREIASRVKEVDAMSATLLELENHSGLAHVRRYPPTGVTAERWATTEASLARLWEDLGRMTSILDSVRTLRARETKLGDDDRAELTRLLFDRPLEVSRQRIPLAKRLITDPAELVVNVGLADTADRMRTAYPPVAEFLDAVDEVDTLVVEGLAPSQVLLDAVGAAGPKEIAELLATSATDPLSLTAHDIDRRVGVIADVVKRRVSEIADLAALQANWPEALATTAAKLTVLKDATLRVGTARRRVEQTVVAGPLPVHADAEPGLRAELADLTTQSGTVPDAAALTSLQRRIDAALTVALQDEELAQGLLDRRSELTGRLSAYHAKAARLGLGEDRDLLAAKRIAVDVLAHQPCDLRAATRALADYQQTLLEKQGKTR